MTIAVRVAHHARSIAIEEAIRERWSFRAWYRGTARRLFDRRWDDLAVDNDRELRTLIRRLRRERSWTESELREAYGR